jgi:hypothetical protein
MDFNPDAYLAGEKQFDPDAYLSGFNPDEYLNGGVEPTAKNTLLDLASAMPFSVANQAQGIKRSFADLIGNEEMAANAKAAQEQLQQEQAKTKLNLGDGVGSMVYQGIKGTLENAPALALGAINPALGLGAIAAGTGGQAYSKYRDRGATKAEAATGGLLEGGIEAGTEVLPMGFLLKNLGRTGFINMVKGIAIREGLGEQVAILTQDAVDTAIANPNKTWSDYLAERPKAALATAIATGVQVGLTGAAGAGVHRLSPKGPVSSPTDLKDKLDALDAAKDPSLRSFKDRYENPETVVGEGTQYAGKDGAITSELPRKITESPEQIDLARTEMQNNLQREATAREEQAQGELFPKDLVTGEPTQIQENLDLLTKPTEQEVTPEANPAGISDSSWAAMVRPFSADDFVGKSVTLPNGKTFVTPETILQHIRKLYSTKPHAELGPILDVVERMLGRFQEGGMTTHGLQIELSDKDALRAPGHKESTAAGYYHAFDNSLVLGKRGQNDRTFIHEILHGMTERFMEAFPNDPDVKALKALLDEIKAKDRNITALYGASDHSEMISEAFSSNLFKNALMKIKVTVDGKVVNAWRALQDKIAKVLGIETQEEHSAFIKVLDLAEKISTKYAKDPSKTVDQYQRLAKLGKLPSQLKRLEALAVEAGGVPEHVSNAAKSTPTAGTPETAKAAQIEKVSGDVYIPKAPKVTPELIAQIAKEPDSTAGNVTSGPFQNIRNVANSARRNLTPGALSQSFLTGSTLVKTVYDAMNSGFKKGQYKIHTIVKPVQDTFIKIMKNPQTAAMSHEILMREMKKGVDYTAEELRSIGVSDDLIKAHLEFRNMMQQALEAQNAARREAGDKEITALDSYVSSRWSGPWRANIKDSEGNIIFQIAEHSRKGANDALQWIKTKHPDLVFEDPSFKRGFEKGDSVEAGYLEMLKLLDKDDPRVASLESIYKDYLLNNTENVSNQEKHHLRKKGVRGFAGDRPWAKHDVQDFFTQQFAYAENAFRWSEAQAGLRTSRELLNHPDLQESQKNNILFAKDYVKNELGFGTNATFEALDNGLAQALGTSPAELQKYMGGTKTFFYLSKLGLSLPFTVSQLLQPLISTPAHHTLLSTEGFKHNPIQTTFKAMLGGGQAALWHYGTYFNSPELQKMAERTMSKLDKEAVRYMEANEIVDINPMTDIKKGLRPESINIAAAPFEFTIKHSEILSRSMAFMGYVDHLKQSGKFDTSTQGGRMKLFQRAEEQTQLSMTDYRSKERAMVFEKGGLTGDAAATLQSFSVNYIMQLVKFSREAANGNPRPLFTMVAMQAMAAGMLGLWGVDDLDDLLDNMKKLLPHDQYMKVKDFSIKNFLLNNMKTMVKSGLNVDDAKAEKISQGINYGLVSALTGTNIHTRMNASDLIPVWPFESQEDPMKNILGLAPFVSSTYDVATGAAAALNPNKTSQERWAGAYKAAPVVAQGPMENLPAFSDNGVSLKPKDLSQGKIRRTEEEKNLRNYGFKSPREQKLSDQEFQLSKVERELQNRVSIEGKKATQFVISGDPKSAVEHMIKYDQLGGDIESLINSIPKAKIDRVTTELQRRALTAQGGGKASILKLQRYLQLVDNEKTPSEPAFGGR